MLMTDICRRLRFFHLGNPPPGGGGTPSNKSYRYVPPQRVWFLDLFSLYTGVNVSLESSMVFERTMGAYERIFRINFK